MILALLVCCCAAICSVAVAAPVACVAYATVSNVAATFSWVGSLALQSTPCQVTRGVNVPDELSNGATIQTCGYVYSGTHSWGALSQLSYNSSSLSTKDSPMFDLDYTNGDLMIPATGGPTADVYRQTHVVLTCIAPKDSTTTASCTINAVDNNLLKLSLTQKCPAPLSASLPFPDIRVSYGGVQVVTNGYAISPADVPQTTTSTADVTVKSVHDSTIVIQQPTVTVSPKSAATVTITGDLAPGGVQLTAGSSKKFTLNAQCSGSSDAVLTVTFAVSTLSPAGDYAGIPFKTVLVCSSGISDGGMSAAGVFFLIVFLFITIGCVGGYVYKHTQLGLRGLEAVPLIDTMRSGWSKLQERLANRSYTQDSVVAMQVTPNPASFSKGYQDVAD